MARTRRQAFALALVLIAGPAASTRADEGTPSAFEQIPGGWTDLLAKAGPNLDGWVRGPVPTKGKIGTLGEVSQWSLDPKTGTLLCTGEGGHDWVRWNQELGDFVLHVEWRFTPAPGKKGNYNSGIYVRNSADGLIWHQAQTGNATGGYLFGETPVDGKTERINLSKQVTDKRVKPAGEWNTYEITCKGKDIILWVNGAVTCEWHDCQYPRGYVGLEAEGWRIKFRNVMLKPL